MRWIVLCLGIFGYLGAGASTSARDLGQWESGDPALKQWYQALMQPDVPNASCCGEADAYWADEIHVRDGKTYAIVTDDRPDEPRGRPHVDIGTEIEIPRQQTQMGQIESDWSRHRIPEPHPVCVLLRSARWCLTQRCVRRRGSSRRNMRAGAGPRPRAALVDRDVAIVDALLVHPFSAESFLAGQRADRRGAVEAHVLSRRCENESDSKQ